MTKASKPRLKIETAQHLDTANSTLQERIETIIAEAIKNAPPPLSVEEQKKKNQAAIGMLRQWDEEDATDDPEELARREADWQEFKKGMNENSLSGQIIYPAEDYP